MLMLNLAVFVIGMFMEEVAVLTLLTPIFAPLAMRAGINPLWERVIISSRH